MVLLDVTLAGDPVPKERPRMSRNGHTYTAKRTRTAEGSVRVLVEAHRQPCWPVSEPVGIAIEFHCATRHRKDGDNLLKLVTDALNGIVFADDVLIEEWFCRVHRGVGPAAARTEVFVYLLREMEPGVG